MGRSSYRHKWWKACKNKLKLSPEEAAQIIWKRPAELGLYLCSFCGWVHFGHQLANNKGARQSAGDKGMVNPNELKLCRNPQCRRYKIVVATGGKRCSMCKSKLKGYRGDEAGVDHDMPALVDGTDHRTDDKNFKCKHGVSIWDACEGCGRRAYSERQSGTAIVPYRGESYVVVGDKRDDQQGVFFTSDGHDGKEGGCDISGECPILRAEPRVEMPFDIFSKCLYLAHKLNIEWLAYGKGTLPASADDPYVLAENGLYFPKQIASGATVRIAPDGVVEPDTILSIHSHVDMDATFSTTDRENWNFPIEMIINRAGKIACVTRATLECGRFQRVKSKVVLTGDSTNMDVHAQLRAQLTEKTYRSSGSGNGMGFHVVDNRSSGKGFSEADYWREQDRYARDMHDDRKGG